MEKNQYMGAGKARARQCAPINTWARGTVRAEPQKGEHGTSLVCTWSFAPPFYLIIRMLIYLAYNHWNDDLFSL